MVGTVGSMGAEDSTPGGRARCVLWSPWPKRCPHSVSRQERERRSKGVTPCGGCSPHSVPSGSPLVDQARLCSEGSLHRGHRIPALQKLLSPLSPLLINWVLAGKLIL